MERKPHPALLVAAAGWVGLILLAPLAAERGWGIAPWLYYAFGLICHQIPERSFFLDGHQLAVCHRCSGLYVGGLVGLLALPWLTSLRRWLTDAPRRMLWFFLPLLVDVALPAWNSWWSRFGTGLVAALPVALLLWLAADQILHGTGASPAETENQRNERTPTRLQVASGKGKS